MVSIFAQLGWVLFDIWVSYVTAPALPLWEWRVIAFGGSALVVANLIGSLLDRHADTKKTNALNSRIGDLQHELSESRRETA
ncbi:hypothetical protein, partial [Candidatus Binatus sp.]|uniref:hypothetical protein n=1 Tax=Candidatus Binatus sp. TaxID=2811406 RepID=UPI003C6EE020